MRVTMNGHIMKSHTDPARPCKAVQIPSEAIADIHECARSVPDMESSPRLYVDTEAKMAPQPTTTGGPADEDTVPCLGAITARRPPPPSIFSERGHAQARWSRSRGEITARELCSMARSRITNALNPAPYRPLLHFCPRTNGEQERPRLCCRRSQIREGSHRRLSPHKPWSGFMVTVNTEDHLVGAGDFPPPRASQHARIVPLATAQQSWRCGASNPSVQSVLVPYHATMLPAEPP